MRTCGQLPNPVRQRELRYLGRRVRGEPNAFTVNPPLIPCTELGHKAIAAVMLFFLGMDEPWLQWCVCSLDVRRRRMGQQRKRP